MYKECHISKDFALEDIWKLSKMWNDTWKNRPVKQSKALIVVTIVSVIVVTVHMYFHEYFVKMIAFTTLALLLRHWKGNRGAAMPKVSLRGDLLKPAL